jgi:hypothetical protein
MTPFLEQVAGLAPTIQQQLVNCPQVMPSRDQLIALKPKIQSFKAWFSSRGQDGNLGLIQECTVFGLLDKDNLPTNAIGWGNWVMSLDTQVNSAIASGSAEGANVVIRNNVNETYLDTNGNNTSLVNSAVNSVANTADQVFSWWNTPVFTVYDYKVTPFNIAVMYGVYHVVSRRMS